LPYHLYPSIFYAPCWCRQYFPHGSPRLYAFFSPLFAPSAISIQNPGSTRPRCCHFFSVPLSLLSLPFPFDRPGPPIPENHSPFPLLFLVSYFPSASFVGLLVVSNLVGRPFSPPSLRPLLSTCLGEEHLPLVFLPPPIQLFSGVVNRFSRPFLLISFRLLLLPPARSAFLSKRAESLSAFVFRVFIFFGSFEILSLIFFDWLARQRRSSVAALLFSPPGFAGPS